MIKRISFDVLGPPIAKGRPRFARIGKFVQTYTPKRTKDAEKNFLSQAIKHKPKKPFEGPIYLRLRFIKPKPKGRKKDDNYWRQKPDWENLAKITDCLNKVFWKDDSQIVDAHVSKFYGSPARTEVEIIEIDDMKKRGENGKG